MGHKVLATQGKSLMGVTKLVHQFCKAQSENDALKEFTEPLSQVNKEWGEITTKIGMKAIRNPDEIGAAAVDYLMYADYVVLAYCWVETARTAAAKLATGTTEEGFYKAKLQTVRQKKESYSRPQAIPRTVILDPAVTVHTPGMAVAFHGRAHGRFSACQ